MVPICEKPDRLGLVGNGKKSQGTVLTLRNLGEPDKRGDNPDGDKNQTHDAPLTVTELDHAKKDCEWRQQRKHADPRRARRHADRQPRQLTPQQTENSDHLFSVRQSCPEPWREWNKLHE